MIKWNRYSQCVPNPKDEYKSIRSFLIRYTFGDDFFHYNKAFYDYDNEQFIPLDSCFSCEKCTCTRKEILEAYGDFKITHWASLEHSEDYC